MSWRIMESHDRLPAGTLVSADKHDGNVRAVDMVVDPKLGLISVVTSHGHEYIFETGLGLILEMRPGFGDHVILIEGHVFLFSPWWCHHYLSIFDPGS